MSDPPHIRLRLSEIAPYLRPIEISGGNLAPTSPDCSGVITATRVGPLYDVELCPKHAQLTDRR